MFSFKINNFQDTKSLQKSMILQHIAIKRQNYINNYRANILAKSKTRTNSDIIDKSITSNNENNNIVVKKHVTFVPDTTLVEVPVTMIDSKIISTHNISLCITEKIT